MSFLQLGKHFIDGERNRLMILKRKDLSEEMTFVYTVFFIEWEACKDFLRDIRFPARSQIEVHVFHRKDTDQNQLRSTIPDKRHHDGRPIIMKHSSLTSFPNAVEDLLVYYASSFDFSRHKKPDVYLVSGEGRRYEELAKILRKDRRVSAWVIDGRRTTLLDWLDANCVCKMCKFIFESAHEGVQHYDEFHMK